MGQTQDEGGPPSFGGAKVHFAVQEGLAKTVPFKRIEVKHGGAVLWALGQYRCLSRKTQKKQKSSK